MNRTQAAPVTLRRVNPGGPADLIALSEFFAGLSIRARYRRFFAAITPTRAMLRFLSGGAQGAWGVDAVIATCGDNIVGHAIAVDRAESAGPRTTEIGVVVADAWQGHGLGSALTRSLLTAAQARGVTSVTMDVQHGNRRVLAMIASHWPCACTSHGPDGATVRSQLQPDQLLQSAGQPAQSGGQSAHPAGWPGAGPPTQTAQAARSQYQMATG